MIRWVFVGGFGILDLVGMYDLIEFGVCLYDCCVWMLCEDLVYLFEIDWWCVDFGEWYVDVVVKDYD